MAYRTHYQKAINWRKTATEKLKGKYDNNKHLHLSPTLPSHQM